MEFVAGIVFFTKAILVGQVDHNYIHWWGKWITTTFIGGASGSQLHSLLGQVDHNYIHCSVNIQALFDNISRAECPVLT